VDYPAGRLWIEIEDEQNMRVTMPNRTYFVGRRSAGSVRRLRAVALIGLLALVSSSCGLPFISDDEPEAIRFLVWEGYEVRDPVPEDYVIEATFMVANEDPINKKGTYDISVGIENIFPTLQAAGVMQPLDLSRIPNWNQLPADLRNEPLINTSDGVIGVPIAWASMGLTYVDDGTGPPESLESLLLEDKYRGKFAIGDDGNTVIIMIARGLGLGGDTPGLLTEAELDQVFEKLEQFRDASFGVMANPYAEYAGAYARKEIIAAFPDNAPTALRAREAGIPVEVYFPPDVGWSWIDALFIASDVEPTDAMYSALNDAISESTQFTQGKALGWAVTHPAAMERLIPMGMEWSVYADMEAVLAAAPAVEWPPVESSEYATYDTWLKRWQDFKAGG
jgi:spermidine/putrescine-binding protein